MRKLKKVAAALTCVLTLSISTPALPADSDLLVEIIVDNGVGQRKPGEAKQIVGDLLKGLYLAGKNRKFRFGQVEIVTTSTADINDVPRTTWSGPIIELKQRFDEITQAVSHVPNGCSDLERAFAEVHQNVNRTAKKQIWVFVVSPLIHVGRPCDNSKISLPQPVPTSINLGGLVGNSRVERLIFLGADGDQRLIWQNALTGAGSAIRANENNLEALVFNKDETSGWIATAELEREMKR